MISDDKSEEIATYANQIYNRNMTFDEFRKALDIRYYNQASTLIYKIIFITLNVSKD